MPASASAPAPKHEQLKWLENIAVLMDRSIRIPGTNARFGLDPIIGLFPVVGDLVSFGVSSVLLYAAFTHGASGKVIIRMLINIALDATIGMIPIVGAIFDFVYKANSKNYQLLAEHWEEGKHQGSGMGYIILALFVLLLLIALVGYICWRLAEFLIGLF